MIFGVTLFVLCLFSCVFGDLKHVAIPYDRVTELHFKRGAMTTGRRGSPILQLDSEDGTANPCKEAICNRVASSSNAEHWHCTGEFDGSYEFDRLDVGCEGYDYPEDPNILSGSCALRYTVKPEELVMCCQNAETGKWRVRPRTDDRFVDMCDPATGECHSVRSGETFEYVEETVVEETTTETVNRHQAKPAKTDAADLFTVIVVTGVLAWVTVLVCAGCCADRQPRVYVEPHPPPYETRSRVHVQEPVHVIRPTVIHETPSYYSWPWVQSSSYQSPPPSHSSRSTTTRRTTTTRSSGSSSGSGASSGWSSRPSGSSSGSGASSGGSSRSSGMATSSRR